MRALLVTLVLVAGLSSLAYAEDVAVYETEGDADAAAADARVSALDDAFARAVAQALGDVTDADARKAHRAALNEHILGRARLWVARFTVTRDETADGRRQLTVTVRIDRDKLRARLAELNIAAAAAPGSDPVKPGAKAAIVLLRTADARGARASFGPAAEKELPGLGALAGALRGGGLAIKRAPATETPVRAEGALPLEDDAAAALAAEAKAELAAIAGVTVGDPVAARGVASPIVLVTAHLRLIGGGQLVGQGTAAVAARGTEASVVAAAIERALVAAAADVVPPARRELAKGTGVTGDDTPIAEPGVVLVRLAPKTPWMLVAAELKWLQGAKGVQRAVVRRASPAGWVLGVTTTESIERIAQIARKPPLTGASVKVKIAGDLVEVALEGAP